MGAFLIAVPFLLGALTVVQAGLNSRQAATLGLNRVVLINALVLLLCSIVSYVAFEFKRTTSSSPITFSWQLLVPGAIGYAIVVGGPWSVAQWGAARTFVLFVGAQLLAGLLWDYFAAGVRPSPVRLLGIALTWLGVFVSTL